MLWYYFQHGILQRLLRSVHAPSARLQDTYKAPDGKLLSECGFENSLSAGTFKIRYAVRLFLPPFLVSDSLENAGTQTDTLQRYGRNQTIIMLKSLRIQNFKAWKDTGTIRMAPITLFFGANSSGKSSIGQFLMMLKQTVESPDRRAVLYPGGVNTAVQLGSYAEMVFRRDLNNKIAFEYSWSLTDDLKFKSPGSDEAFTGNGLAFQAEVGSRENQSAPELDTLKYELLTGDKNSMSIAMKRHRLKAKSKYQVEANNYPLRRWRGRAWDPGAPIHFYGFPDEVVAYYQDADFVKEFNLQHEKLFRSLYYLGPLRTKAERLYLWDGTEPDGVGFAGGNTVAAMLAARDRNRRINLGFNQRKRPFEEIIASKLKEMRLIEEFAIHSISDQRRAYEVKLQARSTREWVDLPDVGFGISQVLPVLVECFYAPPNSIIIVEQPEIHLHPGAQSALADVMIDAINAREDSRNRNIQLIIETHSEHFLRRLQRRIAEEKLPQEHLSAYFAKSAEAQSNLEPLQIDPFGNIRNWPEHFFGDEMEDITAQAKSTMNRRLTALGAAESG